MPVGLDATGIAHALLFRRGCFGIRLVQIQLGFRDKPEMDKELYGGNVLAKKK
jgi:hypothetical protein